jgi:hypothetical protein
MAKYFSYFPTTPYIKDDDSSDLDTLTNITARFGFEESFKENNSAYYEYEVRDGDTPEVIASKIYGDSEKHWIILSFNDITDPNYDWPLEQRTLVSFIDAKYTANADTANGQTGIVWSKANIKEYYKVETTTHNASETITINKYEIDANTYANVSSSTTSGFELEDGSFIDIAVSKETKTYYDYEIEENEKKRNIKILKPEFVSAVVQEFRRVIVNGE